MIDPINNPKQDNTEQQIKFPKTKKKVHEMSRPHGGMKLFCIDARIKFPKIDDVKEAEYDYATIPYKDETKNPLPKIASKYAKRVQLQLENIQVRKRISVNEYYYYVWAINKKNALKRWLKARSIS